MSKKATNIILIIYVIALTVLVIGATYAHFTYIKVSRISPKVDVEAATLNYIMFDIGSPIFINPTPENFTEGMDNLTGETYASVFLKRENGTEVSKLKYNLYLEISDNSLTYSTASKTPELLLNVYDPDGNEVKEIEGLKYVTIKDGKNNKISGFDITEGLGRYYITKSREISTTSEITEKWDAKVTYVNLKESQDGNLEKVLNGLIRIEKAEE